MPLREAEAIILRTYPLKETDKIVSFLAREFGKCRGVSRGARRTRSSFGASLEPLSLVRIAFFERENRDLSTIDRCEVLESMVPVQASDYGIACGLGYVAEVADRMLPEHEANAPVFRLMLVVLAHIRAQRPLWLALTYYMYWMARLGGILPELSRCGECRHQIPANEDAYFHPVHEGVRCRSCRYPGAQAIDAAVRGLTASTLRGRLEEIDASPWSDASYAADLRRFLNQTLERHTEARFKSWPLLVAA